MKVDVVVTVPQKLSVPAYHVLRKCCCSILSSWGDRETSSFEVIDLDVSQLVEVAASLKESECPSLE